MKLPAALLVGSLTVNLVVAAVFIWRPAATRAFLRQAFGSEVEHPASTSLSSKNVPPTTPPPPAPADEAPSLASIDWAHLQRADFSNMVTRLTATGIPADMARTMTAVMIMKYFDQRRRAVRPNDNPAEYWRNPGGRPPDAKEAAAYREIELEQRMTLRDAVGADFNFGDDGTAQRRQFGNLSEEKVAKLKKIFADYSDLEEQLYADGIDRNSAEARAKNALLTKEKRTDIERLLTPEELLDYDLRNSVAAHRLRGKIGAFAATEAEFQALYPAFKAAADADQPPPFGGGRNSADVRRARETAERALESELRRVLSPDRFAEWQEANDHSLQETRELAASLNLPPTTLADVVAIQKEIQPKLATVDRDRDLTPNQRDAQLAALGTEARERLIRVLGPAGFEAYKRRGGGWLGEALSRAPTRPP